MTRWQKVWREPLFQFLLIGAALVVVSQAMVKPRLENDRVIEVSAARIQELVDAWTARWGRRPTAAEKQALIDDTVREEVLYREALALGLDRDDTIIRRRLAQKMSFLLDSSGPADSVTDDELQAFVDKHRELFIAPPLYDFHHIFFSADSRLAPTQDAQAALKKVEAGTGAEQVGDVFSPGKVFRGQSGSEVRRVFGHNFMNALEKAPPGVWEGPIQSAYGAHLVYVDARSAPSMPSLKDIKLKALDLYLEERRKAAAEESYHRVRSKYSIVGAAQVGEAD